MHFQRSRLLLLKKFAKSQSGNLLLPIATYCYLLASEQSRVDVCVVKQLDLHRSVPASLHFVV